MLIDPFYNQLLQDEHETSKRKSVMSRNDDNCQMVIWIGVVGMLLW